MSSNKHHDESLFNLSRELMLSHWGKTEFSLDRLKECFPPHKLFTLLNNFRYQYFEGMMVNNACYQIFNNKKEEEDNDEVENAYSSLFEYYWLVKHVSKQDPLVSNMVSIHEKWNRDYLDSLIIFPEQFITKYGDMTREFVELFFDFYIYWGYYRDFVKAEEIALRMLDLLKQVKEIAEIKKKEKEQQEEEAQNQSDNDENNEQDNEQLIVEKNVEDENASPENVQQDVDSNEEENGEEENDEDYSYLFEEPSDIEKFYSFLYPKYYSRVCNNILDLTFKLNEYEDMSERLSVLVYEGLGSMFSHINNIEKAFTYFSKINVCGAIGESFIRAHLLNNIGRYEEAYQLVKSLTKEEHFYQYISEYAFTLGMSNRIEELVQVLELVLQDSLHPRYEIVKWIHSTLYFPNSTEKIANQFKCHGRFVFRPPEIVYATICNSFGTYYHNPFIIEAGNEMLCDSDFYKSNPFSINCDQISIHIPMVMSPSEIYRNITINMNIGMEKVTYEFDNSPHFEDITKNNQIQFSTSFKSEGIRVLQHQNILVSDNLTKPFYISLENSNIDTFFYENNIILKDEEGKVQVLSMRTGEILVEGQNNISNIFDDLAEDSINHKLMFALGNNDLVVFPQSGIPKTFSNLQILCYPGIYGKLIIDEKEYLVSHCYGYESIDGKHVMCELLFDINEGTLLKTNNLNFPLLDMNKITLVAYLEECKVIVVSHENKTYFYNIEKNQIIDKIEVPELSEFRLYTTYRDMLLIHPRYEKEAFVFKVETNENGQTVKKFNIPVEDFIVRAKFCGDDSIVVLMGNCSLVEFDLRSGKTLGMFSFPSTFGNIMTFFKHTPSKRRFLLYGDEMGIVYILELYKFE